MSSIIAYSQLVKRPVLHSGIGGTWSADMKSCCISREDDSLKDLIRSGALSAEQKRSLQTQILAQDFQEKLDVSSTISAQDVVEILQSLKEDGLISFQK